jgi:catechol 2,3-dioxygenase-like lactoylglutathione lyase family enzyme
VIRRLSKVSIPVHDQAVAARFFSEVLGMTLVCDEPLDNGLRWMEFTPVGADVAVVPYTWWEGLGDRPGTFTRIVLEVDNMAATYQSLRGRGVVFDGPPETGTGGTFATMRDPFGNGYTLVEPDD